jgi:hypothetical protein
MNIPHVAQVLSRHVGVGHVLPERFMEFREENATNFELKRSFEKAEIQPRAIFLSPRITSLQL